MPAPGNRQGQPAPAWWPWEVATHAPASAMPGLVPPRLLTGLTWGLAACLALVLGLLLGWAGVMLALVLARLIALDLTTYTLPDVYTLPLLAVAVVAAVQHGAWPQLGAGLGVLVVYGLVNRAQGLRALKHLGGGDYKLLAAILVATGGQATLWAVALGCALWLPVAFWRPTAPIPFGVPLLLGALGVAVYAAFFAGF